MLLFSIPAITPPIMTPIPLRAAFGGRAFITLLGTATATMPVGIPIGSPLWGLAKDATGDYTMALAMPSELPSSPSCWSPGRCEARKAVGTTAVAQPFAG